MSVNRYERPAESNYFNTYVPIPFQEMALAVGQKQRDYELNAAKEDQFRDYLLDFKVAPGKDEQTYRDKMLKLDTDLMDLHDKVPDLSSIEYKTGLNKLIKGFVRDPWVRQAPGNRELYIEGMQKLAEAEGENDQWNYYNTKKAMDNFIQTGTEGLIENSPVGSGFLQLPGVTKKVNMVEAIDRFLSNFQQEGKSGRYTDVTGEHNIGGGWSGVPFAEVASVAGFQVDKKGELVKDENGDYIVNPNSALMTEIGSNLTNQARFLAEQQGVDPNQMLKDLYTSMVLPKVYQHSGIKTDEENTLTDLGQRNLESTQMGVPYVDAVSAAMGSDSFKGMGKQSWFYKGMKLLANAMTYNGVMTVPGLIMKGEMIPMEKVADYLKTKYSDKEEALAAIDDAFAQTIKTVSDADKSVLGFGVEGILGFASKPIQSSIKLMVETTWDANPPTKPSEDYKKLASKILKEKAASYSSQDWNLLTKEEKVKLNDEAMKDIGDWNKRAVQVKINPLGPKAASEMSIQMFGPDAKDGVLESQTVSGIAKDMLCFNEENLGSNMTLNEMFKKEFKKGEPININWIGRVDVGPGNTMSPGLHKFVANGKDFFIKLDQDAAIERPDWWLQDGGRHLSGIGSWFPMGQDPKVKEENWDDNSLLWARSVIDEYDASGAPLKAHVEYATNADVLKSNIKNGRGAIANSKILIESIDPERLDMGTLYPYLSNLK
jgi:hypothetical protein